MRAASRAVATVAADAPLDSPRRLLVDHGAHVGRRRPSGRRPGARPPPRRSARRTRRRSRASRGSASPPCSAGRCCASRPRRRGAPPRRGRRRRARSAGRCRRARARRAGSRAGRAIRLPTATPPVKATSSTSGCASSSSSITSRSPVTIATASGGIARVEQRRASQSAAERRLLRRLEHDRRPRGDRGRHLVGHLVQRVVEGRDRGDEPHRLAHREAPAARAVRPRRRRRRSRRRRAAPRRAAKRNTSTRARTSCRVSFRQRPDSQRDQPRERRRPPRSIRVGDALEHLAALVAGEADARRPPPRSRARARRRRARAAARCRPPRPCRGSATSSRASSPALLDSRRTEGRRVETIRPARRHASRGRSEQQVVDVGVGERAAPARRRPARARRAAAAPPARAGRRASGAGRAAPRGRGRPRRLPSTVLAVAEHDQIADPVGAAARSARPPRPARAPPRRRARASSAARARELLSVDVTQQAEPSAAWWTT